MRGPTTSVIRQFVAGAAACLIGVASGSSFGWVAPTLVKLAEPDTEIVLTSSEASWMIAILEVGNILTPIPTALLADRLGRKPVILSTGPLYIIAWLILLRFKHLAALCISRVIQGFAMGTVLTVVPMYLGEIASTNIRGAIANLFAIAFYLGYLYEYIIGPFVSYNNLIIASIFLPICFLLLFCWQPESPHFYIMQGKADKAENSLMWLRGTTNIEDIKDELMETTKNVEEEMSNKVSFKDIVATHTDRRALLIVQVVAAVRMLSGQPPIASYSTDLFQKSGFTLIPPYAMTIIMGSVQVISAFFSSALLDNMGRRPLLIISTVGCAFSLGFISLFFYFFNSFSEYTWICPLCLVLFNLFLAFGLDPVSITYRSEMFPANTRAVASSINTINFTIGAFITLKLYQTVADNIGVYFIFLMFSLSCFLGSIWMYFYTIETKNKTFAEIQQDLLKTTNKLT